MEPEEDDLEARYYRAAAALDRGSWEAARREFEILVLDAPRFAPAWDGLARAYVGQDDLRRAEEAFRKAIRADRGAWATRYHWGVALLRAGRIRNAMRLLREALRLGPTERSILLALGQCYLELGEPEEALFRFTEALAQPERDVRDSQVLLAIGTAEGERGEWEAAEAAYQKACLLAPDDPEVYYRWATLAARSGDRAGAERLALRSKALDRRSFSAPRLLVTLAAEAGEWPRAEAEIAALRARPEAERLALALEAELAARLGHLPEARDRAVSALLAPGDPDDGAVDLALETLRSGAPTLPDLQGFRIVLEVEQGRQVYYRPFVVLAPDEVEATRLAGELQDRLDDTAWRVSEVETFDHEGEAAPGVYQVRLRRTLFPRPGA
jgi:tetratricopeptide (TPR) repeat protein